MAATSIFFIGIIASKARFASSPPAASASADLEREGLFVRELRAAVRPRHGPPRTVKHTVSTANGSLSRRPGDPRLTPNQPPYASFAALSSR
jgi:hypothetical protein